MNEWLLVATKPITDSNNYLFVFSAARNCDGLLWLDGYDGYLGYRWFAGCGYQLVFSRGK